MGFAERTFYAQTMVTGHAVNSNDDTGLEINMLEKIVKPLLSWYDGHARVLPWRESVSAYRVWVSEIMLQQTRVEAVKPYFARFLEALPDIPSLAVCPRERLLKLWEGLGYYNRVINMQKAAVIISEQYNGEMPADYEKILALPGIGSYTAGAVASIAFGIPRPAVDGNVMRVVSRLTESEADIARQSVKQEIERSLSAVIPGNEPGKFNQAMMELGATVCIPRGQPRCGECPLAGQCLARLHGREEELPVKARPKARTVEERTVFIIRDTRRAAIRKRPQKGLLAGLYELPSVIGHLDRDEALKRVKDWGLSPLRITDAGEAKHIFSHIEWRMVGYLITVEDEENWTGEEFLLVETEKTQREYPIPAAFAAYVRFLEIRLGQDKYTV